jgi:hypothetical protein
MERMSQLPETLITSLVVENWRLIRVLERIAGDLPVVDQPRVTAQARYSSRKLSDLLSDADMSIATFDGRPFEASLPVSAINLADFEKAEGLIVQETVEPAVLQGGRVAVLGKVIVSESSNVSRN